MQSAALIGRRALNALSNHAATNWYSFKNQADPVRAEVWIYDEIGYYGLTAADFASELNDITAPELLVHLSSVGGDIFDGVAVYNSLRTHSARVTVQVDSMAASIASVIAQAGDDRAMVTGSQMMIHNAHTIAAGDADDFEQFAEMLRLQNDIIAGIYAERAGDGRRKSHYLALMRDETWMTPAQAVEEGLADRIIKPEASKKAADPEPAAETKDAVDLSAFIASMEVGAA